VGTHDVRTGGLVAIGTGRKSGKREIDSGSAFALSPGGPAFFG